MSGSSFGNILKIQTFGESHGISQGVVIDGVPAGILLCEEDFIEDMDRRKPSNDKSSTTRKESDTVHILSGVFDGKTTGTPIALVINNENQNSKAYDNIKDLYRPGHGDFTYDAKYGFRDYRGGGRSSGRETVGRVAAGVVAKKICSLVGITFNTSFVYPETIPENDSVGGKVFLEINNVPAGLGEPVFNKLDALLSMGIMSIGAIKAVEIGDGCKVSETLGSENNDEFINLNGKITTRTNHCGGILAGISTGNTINLTAYVKPVPSISLEQNTVNRLGEEEKIVITGRHDKCIVPRVAPVIEAMGALVIADALLSNMTAKAENITKIYN